MTFFHVVFIGHLQAEYMLRLLQRKISSNANYTADEIWTALETLVLPVILIYIQSMWKLERCNPWPHVANRHISSQLLSLWRHSYYDVVRAAHAYGARNPQLSQLFSLWCHSHYDVIRYWIGHAQRYGHMYVRTDTLPRLIYKDFIYFYSTPQCSHCKCCISYGNSVRPSVRHTPVLCQNNGT